MAGLYMPMRPRRPLSRPSKLMPYTAGRLSVCGHLAELIMTAALLLAPLQAAAQSQSIGAGSLDVVIMGTSLSARGGWQEPLQQMLTEAINRPVEIIDLSVAGGTSRTALSRIDDMVAAQPDLLLVEFATNDAALDGWISVEDSLAHVVALVTQARQANADMRIMIQTMNPVFGMRRWPRPFQDQYEQAHRLLAGEMCLDHIDHRAALWDQLSAEELARVIPDGLHPAPDLSADAIAGTLAAAILTPKVACVSEAIQR
jgi:acyl-CoA thioesterase-1